MPGGKLRAACLPPHQGGLLVSQSSFGVLYTLLSLTHPTVISGDLILLLSDDLLQLRQLDLFEDHIGIFLQRGNIIPAVFDLLRRAPQFRQYIHTVFDIGICLRRKGLLQFFQLLLYVLLLPDLTVQFTALDFRLLQLHPNSVLADIGRLEDGRLDGVCHMVLVSHTLPGDGRLVLFQMTVMVAHGDLSQHHIDIAPCVFVAGSDHRGQRTLRRGIVPVQVLGIDQSHTVGFFLPAKPVVRAKSDIKIVRLHQNIETLRVQIPFHRVAPGLVRDLQHLAQDPRFRCPADTNKFLLDSIHHPGDLLRVGQLLFHQILYF